MCTKYSYRSIPKLLPRRHYFFQYWKKNHIKTHFFAILVKKCFASLFTCGNPECEAHVTSNRLIKQSFVVYKNSSIYLWCNQSKHKFFYRECLWTFAWIFFLSFLFILNWKKKKREREKKKEEIVWLWISKINSISSIDFRVNFFIIILV